MLFSGESLNILEGSVVWLYCLADPISPNLTITWAKDDETLVQDVPHIRLMSTGSNGDMYSTFILVIDKFQASDSGEYQCIAQEGGIVSLGNTTRLIGKVFAIVAFIKRLIKGWVPSNYNWPWHNN